MGWHERARAQAAEADGELIALGDGQPAKADEGR
jgi:hypothetical protein